MPALPPPQLLSPGGRKQAGFSIWSERSQVPTRCVCVGGGREGGKERERERERERREGERERAGEGERERAGEPSSLRENHVAC